MSSIVDLPSLQVEWEWTSPLYLLKSSTDSSSRAGCFICSRSLSRYRLWPVSSTSAITLAMPAPTPSSEVSSFRLWSDSRSGRSIASDHAAAEKALARNFSSGSWRSRYPISERTCAAEIASTDQLCEHSEHGQEQASRRRPDSRPCRGIARRARRGSRAPGPEGDAGAGLEGAAPAHRRLRRQARGCRLGCG